MPIYHGFCSGSNPTQSVMADAERTINFYQELIESQAAPTGAALFPTPGQQDYVEVSPDINTRAIFSEAGRTFAVVGGGLYELFSPAAMVRRGTVAQDGNLATISSNGVAGGQLFITSGGNGYCYTLSTNVITEVLTNEATMGGMKDGYFLAFNINNGRVRLSNLNDGTTWDATQFFARSIAPDPWKAMVVSNPQIWMIGEQTSEAWYNAGTFPQPFAPILSSFVRFGTNAPFSAKLAGDMLVWLSHTAEGAGVIVGARGYTVTPISNYAVNTSIADFERSYGITDCETLVYQEDGHLFACFSFPTANGTWCVDLGSGQWHERGSWNANQNRYDYWHPRVHCQAFGKHLVGERATGMISEMDVSFGLEADGGPIRRLRIGPPLWANTSEKLVVSRLQLMMDTGLGLVSGQGVSPVVMLRTSSDGRTWSNQRSCGAGAMGQYALRVYFTRCGASDKIWMPEITVSDPVPWRIAGAEIDGQGFYQLSKAA